MNGWAVTNCMTKEEGVSEDEPNTSCTDILRMDEKIKIPLD